MGGGTRHATFSVQGRARTPPVSARRRALCSSESTRSLAADATRLWCKNASSPEIVRQEVLHSNRWPLNPSWTRDNPAKWEAEHRRLELEGSSNWAHDAFFWLVPDEHDEHERPRGSSMRPPWTDLEQDGGGGGAASGGASSVTLHLERSSEDGGW